MYQPTAGADGMEIMKNWDILQFGALTDGAVENWNGRTPENGILHIPSFKISFKNSIKEYLQALGKPIFVTLV